MSAPAPVIIEVPTTAPRSCLTCKKPEPCRCSTINGERLAYLDASDPGWARAWAVLSRRWGSPVCLDIDTGATWQYMGTGRGAHHFRHRRLHAPDNHPKNGERVTDRVPVEPGDFA